MSNDETAADAVKIAKGVNKLLGGIGAAVAGSYIPGAAPAITQAASGVDELIEGIVSVTTKKEKTPLERMDSHDRIGRASAPQQLPAEARPAIVASPTSDLDEADTSEPDEARGRAPTTPDLTKLVQAAGWSPDLATVIAKGPKAAPEVTRMLNAYELVPPPPPRKYTLREGDTLESVALYFYGNRKGAKRIFMANRALLGDSLENLKQGLEIDVPYTQFRNRRNVEGRKVL